MLFLKKYWLHILLVVVFLGFGAWVYHKQSNLNDLLEIQNKSHTEQVEKLKEFHIWELKERDKLIKKHQEELKQIETKYEESKRQLVKEKRRKIRIIIKEQKTPEKLAERIEKAYGFKYIPK